ncbi:hypothetical protein AB0L40_22470 [Patulibacter sp. NPDC049589]|uniref:PepSY domain-containing protein n=1 Tax=Patulibacter sp. NPDC049589 TaxID=3154731 RepID=UPI0034362902
MIKSFKTKTAAIATIGVLSLGGAAVAATTSSNAPTPLTGNITDQASTAALAKYPGATLVGIESKTDGTYEAEVRKADGTEVEVELDKAFKVTGTHAGGLGGHGGHGGGKGGFGRGVDTAALAKTLGVTEAKLQAALEATHGTKDATKGDRAATIAKALDASTTDVQAVLDAQNGGGGRGGHGGGGDNSALVTALAKKTGKSEADVTKALAAIQTARKDAEATALAKELGIDAAKVKTALAAAKPAARP